MAWRFDDESIAWVFDMGFAIGLLVARDGIDKFVKRRSLAPLERTRPERIKDALRAWGCLMKMVEAHNENSL